MITKLWHLKGVFFLIVLFVGFAACVKEKDPTAQRNQIKDSLNEIAKAISNKDLNGLNKYYAQPTPAGQGPNALLAAVAAKGDSTFSMHGRKFSIDGKKASVRFAFTEDPTDTDFSYLYLENDGNWKITGFEIK
jgi:hypothetical protein